MDGPNPNWTHDQLRYSIYSPKPRPHFDRLHIYNARYQSARIVLSTKSSAVAERPFDCVCRWNLERGHSGSFKMVPFESFGTVSYSHSILVRTGSKSTWRGHVLLIYLLVYCLISVKIIQTSRSILRSPQSKCILFLGHPVLQCCLTKLHYVGYLG